MIQHPSRVSEREWIAEQFTQVTLLAGDFEDVGSVQEGVAAVQQYVRENIVPVLEACYALFRCVGADMAARADESPTRADAVARALEYLASPRR